MRLSQSSENGYHQLAVANISKITVIATAIDLEVYYKARNVIVYERL